MTTDKWNPAQYDKFKNERSQPFFDLADLIDPRKKIQSMVDLGCGTGELTKALVEKLQPTTAIGIDNSEEMLKKAKLNELPNLRFKNSALEKFREPSSHDLIFSNAAIQWCDNHPAILKISEIV